MSFYDWLMVDIPPDADHQEIASTLNLMYAYCKEGDWIPWAIRNEASLKRFGTQPTHRPGYHIYEDMQ